MLAFLEILKYILPSLVMFITVYYIMSRYFSHQYELTSLELRKEQYDNTLPIKLKAYERLALFCERISIDNLSYRLASNNVNGKVFGKSMLVAIQQEWEHNLSQQIYVSERLWNIISLAKDNTQSVIGEAVTMLSEGDTPSELMKKIVEISVRNGNDSLQTAKSAINAESKTLF